MTGLHTKLSFYIKKQHTYYHKKKSCIFSLKKRNYNLFKENCQWLVIMYLTILEKLKWLDGHKNWVFSVGYVVQWEAHNVSHRQQNQVEGTDFVLCINLYDYEYHKIEFKKKTKKNRVDSTCHLTRADSVSMKVFFWLYLWLDPHSDSLNVLRHSPMQQREAAKWMWRVMRQ